MNFEELQRNLLLQEGGYPHLPAQELGNMNHKRAAYFMRRFRSEEKLLGPNEQSAVDYVIALLEQSQAQQSQWISVEERLPETYIEDDRKLIALGKSIGASIKSDDVLVLLKTGHVKMDRLAGIIGNEPFWWIYRNLVVSWMPLPPAPEGDKE